MGKFICSLFKKSLFWMITIGLLFLFFHIFINVLIAFLWSFLMNKFLPSSLLFIKYFIILLLFIYNWLILRKIVISWLFEWQFPTQIFSIYKERQNFVSYLKLRLRNFMNAIEAILNVNSKISKKESDDIGNFLELFNDQFSAYEQLYNIVNNPNNNNNLISYKMSGCQIEFYNLLKSINRILNEDDLRNNLLNINNNDNIKMNNITVNQNFENQKNLLQLNMLLKDYQQKLAKYDWDNYTYASPSYFCNLLSNDTFGSLSLLSIQFKKKFEEYHLEDNFTSKNKIHYTLISNNKNGNNNISTDKSLDNNLIDENSYSNERNLMIFCLPNGGCYELLPKTKVEFYLNLGFSFLCWNYNGYGYSKGRANFSNCKAAVLELYDTIMANSNYHFKKICVMGHSIGGIAACYLARNRHVDLLISDRNFCDMTRLVNNFYCGKLLSTLIKYLFIGNTDNINNFFNSNIGNIQNNGVAKIKNINKEDNNNFNKIIIYSPLDFLILNDSTVKSGVSRYIIKNYIIYRNNQNNQVIKDKENLLDIVFNKNDKETFINKFRRLLHLYYSNNNDNNEINDLKEQNNININNNNENILDESMNKVLFAFFDLFFGVCCDNLNYLSQKQLSARRESIFLDNFFNNILIWGIQGGNSDNEDDFEFYSYKGKNIIRDAYNILNKYTLEKIQGNENPVSLIIEKFSEDFKKILDAFDNLDIVCKDENPKIKTNKEDTSESNNKNDLKEKLITNDEKEYEINTNIVLDVDINKKNNLINDEFYAKLNSIKGNIKLFKSFAGHNGLLRPDEREQFFSFLLSTGIVG